MRRRSFLLVAGGVLTLALSMSGHANTASGAAPVEKYKRIWDMKLWMRIPGETIEDVMLSVQGQIRLRYVIDPQIARNPMSIFAPSCTFGQLRDGLRAQFGYGVVPFPSGESVHFRITSGPQPPMKEKALTERAGGTTPRVNDPRLQQKLDFAAVEVEEHEAGLHHVLRHLSEASSIAIIADGAPRAETCPKGMSVAQYLKTLHGMTAGEALERLARTYDYRVGRSGMWYLLRAR